MRRFDATIPALGMLALWLSFANYGLSGDLMGGVATTVWIVPERTLAEFVAIAGGHPALGRSTAVDLAALLVLAPAAILHAIGVPSGIVARLAVALYFFVAMSGAAMLGRTLLRTTSGNASRGVALVGAVLYGVNHTTIGTLEAPPAFAPLWYAALPWLAFGIVDGCERHRARGIAIVVAAMLCAGGAAIGPLGPAFALIAIAFGGTLALAAGSPLRKVAFVAGTGAALGLAACAWWLLPALDGYGVAASRAVAVPASSTTSISTYSALAGALRLAPYGSTDEPFALWFSSPLGALLGCAPLLFALGGAPFSRRRIWAIGAGAFVIFALAAGIRAPLVTTDNVRFDPWMQLASLALLVAFDLGLCGLFAWMARDVRARGAAIATFALAAFAVFTASWPAFAGREQEPQSDSAAATFVGSLPPDYETVAAFLRAHDGDGRALALNDGTGSMPAYVWGYQGNDPLIGLAGIAMAGPDVIPRAGALSADALVRALDALSVRYVVVHDDLVAPQRGAHVETLLARGAVRLAMRTADMRVYERADSPAPPARVLRNPAILEGPRDLEALRSDPSQTSQLVPNDGPAFGDFDVLHGVAAPSLGGIARVLDGFGSAPSAAVAQYGVLQGNPLAAVLVDERCGNRAAVVLRPPTEWSYGTMRLPTFRRKLCLARPRFGPALLDGIASQPATAQVTFDARQRHRLEVREAIQRADVVARRLASDGLVFRFAAPLLGDVVRVALPAELWGEALSAKVVSGDEIQLGSGSVQDGSHAFEIPLLARAPLLGEWCFLDFHGNRRDLLERIRRVGVLRVTIARTQIERFDFPLPFDGDARRARAPLRDPDRERVASPAVQAAMHPAFVWDAPSQTEPSAWRAHSGRVQIDAGAQGTRVVGSASVIDTDRYVLTFDYTARGRMIVGATIDGDVAPRPVRIVADGRVHRAALEIFPPTGSSGRIELVADVRSGHLDAKASLRSVGPNALTYVVTRGAAARGTVDSARRRAPWWLSLLLRDCSPCFVQLGTGAPAQWLVLGARRLGTFAASGQSTGRGWSATVTGAATMALDAGRAPREVELLFVPALLAAFGIAVTLMALVVTAELVRRLPANQESILSGVAAQRGPRWAAALVTVAVCVAVALVALVALAGTGWPGAPAAVATLYFAVTALAVWSGSGVAGK